MKVKAVNSDLLESRSKRQEEASRLRSDYFLKQNFLLVFVKGM